MKLNFETFEKGMTKLSLCFPVTVNRSAKDEAARWRIYFEVLSAKLSEEQFTAAVETCIETCEFFPTPAALIEAAPPWTETPEQRAAWVEQQREKYERLEAEAAERRRSLQGPPPPPRPPLLPPGPKPIETQAGWDARRESLLEQAKQLAQDAALTQPAATGRDGLPSNGGGPDHGA